MKRKLAEMEAEAARLKEAQAGGGSGAAAPAAAASGAAAAAATDAEAAAKEEADTRSVYIGNVDYATAPEELQLHFQSCGTVNRVTIPTDAVGNPKVCYLACMGLCWCCTHACMQSPCSPMHRTPNPEPTQGVCLYRVSGARCS